MKNKKLFNKIALLSVTNNDVLAIDGKLAQRDKQDFEHLREKTKNNICYLGLNTFLDLKPSFLQGRSFIVVTSLFYKFHSIVVNAYYKELANMKKMYQKRGDTQVVYSTINKLINKKIYPLIEYLNRYHTQMVDNLINFKRQNLIVCHKGDKLKLALENYDKQAYLQKIKRLVKQYFYRFIKCEIDIEQQFNDRDHFVFFTIYPNLSEKCFDKEFGFLTKIKGKKWNDTICLLGGSSLYQANLSECDEVYLTDFKKGITYLFDQKINRVPVYPILNKCGFELANLKQYDNFYLKTFEKGKLDKKI